MAKLKNNGIVLWFTGLSGAGKTTLADAVGVHLGNLGFKIKKIDGDILRETKNIGLGFSREDRKKNVEAAGKMAKEMAEDGYIVTAALISPHRDARDKLKKEIDNFLEIFVSAPIEICESRDPKGLYKKARAGEIKNFTGVDDPYEPPVNPEITIETHLVSSQEASRQIVDYLTKNDYLV